MEELTAVEFEEAIQKVDKVLIPLGSVEAHGPHLPLATDLYTIYELCKLLGQEVNFLLAPPLYYGLCRSTKGLYGTISLRGETLKHLILDLLAEFYRFGFKKFLLLSGHAGGTHLSYLIEACEEFVDSHPEVRFLVAHIVDLLQKAFAELGIPPSDSHAGEWETSLMMYLRPSLVKSGGYEDYPKFPKHQIVANKRAYWNSGIWGNPDLATPEKGQILAQKFLEVMKEHLKDF